MRGLVKHTTAGALSVLCLSLEASTDLAPSAGPPHNLQLCCWPQPPQQPAVTTAITHPWWAVLGLEILRCKGRPIVPCRLLHTCLTTGTTHVRTNRHRFMRQQRPVCECAHVCAHAWGVLQSQAQHTCTHTNPSLYITAYTKLH